jgi:hypothetical protein
MVEIMIEKVISKSARERLKVCINNNIELFTEIKQNNKWLLDQTIMLTKEDITKIVKLLKGM